MNQSSIIKCKATGLFFVDYSIRAVMISSEESNAMRIKDERQKQALVNYLRAALGSFDWQLVPA
jgi:hypothetical protein